MRWIRKLVGILLIILAIITALALLATQLEWLVISQHTFFGKILALGTAKAALFAGGTLTVGFLVLPDADRAKVSHSISSGVRAVASTITKSVSSAVDGVFSNLPWLPIGLAVGAFMIWRTYVQSEA